MFPFNTQGHSESGLFNSGWSCRHHCIDLLLGLYSVCGNLMCLWLHVLTHVICVARCTLLGINQHFWTFTICQAGLDLFFTCFLYFKLLEKLQNIHSSTNKVHDMLASSWIGQFNTCMEIQSSLLCDLLLLFLITAYLIYSQRKQNYFMFINYTLFQY